MDILNRLPTGPCRTELVDNGSNMATDEMAVYELLLRYQPCHTEWEIWQKLFQPSTRMAIDPRDMQAPKMLSVAQHLASSEHTRATTASAGVDLEHNLPRSLTLAANS